MAGKGRAVKFHGAYKTKAAAQAKERARKDAFILKRRVRVRGSRKRQDRWIVLTPR